MSDLKPCPWCEVKRLNSQAGALLGQRALLAGEVETLRAKLQKTEYAEQALRKNVAVQNEVGEKLQQELIDMTRERDQYRDMFDAAKRAVVEGESHCLCRADVYQLENEVDALKANVEDIAEIISEYGCDCGDQNDPPCVPCRISGIIAAIRQVRKERGK